MKCLPRRSQTDCELDDLITSVIKLAGLFTKRLKSVFLAVRRAKCAINEPELNGIHVIAELYQKSFDADSNESDVFVEFVAAAVLIRQHLTHMRFALELFAAMDKENSAVYQRFENVHALLVSLDSYAADIKPSSFHEYYQKVYKVYEAEAKIDQYVMSDSIAVTLKEVSREVSALDVFVQGFKQSYQSYLEGNISESDQANASRLLFIAIFDQFMAYNAAAQSCLKKIDTVRACLNCKEEQFYTTIDKIIYQENRESWINIFIEKKAKLDELLIRQSETLEAHSATLAQWLSQGVVSAENEFTEVLNAATMEAENIFWPAKEAVEVCCSEVESIQHLLDDTDLDYSALAQLVTVHDKIAAYFPMFEQLDIDQVEAERKKVLEEITKHGNFVASIKSKITEIYPKSSHLAALDGVACTLEKKRRVFSENIQFASEIDNFKTIADDINASWQPKMNQLFTMLRILFYKLDKDAAVNERDLVPWMDRVKVFFNAFSDEEKPLSDVLRACPQYKTLVLTPIRKKNFLLLTRDQSPQSCAKFVGFIKSIDVCNQSMPQVAVTNTITELELLAEQTLLSDANNSDTTDIEIKATARALHLDVAVHFDKEPAERVAHYRETIHPLKNETLKKALQSAQLATVPAYKTVLLNIGAAFASLIVFYPAVLIYTRATSDHWFFRPASVAQERLKRVESVLETHGDEQHGLVVRPVVA